MIVLNPINRGSSAAPFGAGGKAFNARERGFDVSYPQCGSVLPTSADFAVVGQSCTNRALNPDASCSVEIEFRPVASGRSSALVMLQRPTGEYTSAIVSGGWECDRRR